MPEQAEVITLIIILLATIGLFLFRRLRNDKNLRLRLAESIDDLEDDIENEIGLDLELSEVIDEVIEEIADKTEEVLEDIKEDGVLDESLSDSLKELGDTLEAIIATIKAMTVAQLKKLLKEQGLPLTGKKNDLVERLLALLKP